VIKTTGIERTNAKHNFNTLGAIFNTQEVDRNINNLDVILIKK